MIFNTDLLSLMIQKDLTDVKLYEITNYSAVRPDKINLSHNEILFIINIHFAEYNHLSWLEIHSATESRLIENKLQIEGPFDSNIISRHKGHVYFNTNDYINFQVNYCKLKIIE